MKRKDKYSIRDLKRDFPNEEACLDIIFDTLHTRECSCGGSYSRIPKRKQYQCSQCRFQIAPMAGTIFEKSTTPLDLWFHALFIFSNAKSGISAKELERQLGVTYKTAWRMLKLIRESLVQPKKPLSGDVEADEAFFGGRGNGGRYNKNASRTMEAKVKVLGAVSRKGGIRAQTVQTVSGSSTQRFIEANVKKGSRLFTDGSNRFTRVDNDYERITVDHSRKEWVRGNAHTNAIEGFWSHVKRSTKGTHKVISKKYFQSYLDAFVFHYNNRHSDRVRFASLLGAVIV